MVIDRTLDRRLYSQPHRLAPGPRMQRMHCCEKHPQHHEFAERVMNSPEFNRALLEERQRRAAINSAEFVRSGGQAVSSEPDMHDDKFSPGTMFIIFCAIMLMALGQAITSFYPWLNPFLPAHDPTRSYVQTDQLPRTAAPSQPTGLRPSAPAKSNPSSQLQHLRPANRDQP